MKREWYTYSSTSVWPSELRERLPEALRERLLKDRVFSRGVSVDASDTELLAELDRVMHVGENTDVLRRLKAEADRKSLPDYTHYMIGLLPLAGPSEPSSIMEGETAAEHIIHRNWRWPAVRAAIREVVRWTGSTLDRVILVTSNTKDLFEKAGLRGVGYVPLPDGHWILEVRRRSRCLADQIVISASDRDQKQPNTVSGPFLFGLRYEREDFGPEDLRLVDRIEVGGKTYPYHVPRLIASARFVELCLAQKIDRLKSPNAVFGHGYAALLVGRGRITSTLAEG